MGFLNPGLLAGALLFAVPLVIHLLNRQRHKKRDWAAMEFLLRAYQKTRNRLRNENLLLLLLRCLIPIVLALAIARPVLQRGAALLGQAGSVHHVVVLDQSYSMGLQRDGAPSPFERGRQMALRLLERLQDHPERADKVTLVTAGVRPRFVVRQELNLGMAKAQWLEVQRPEDAATDLVPALLQVAAAVEETQDPHVQVYVLTDLQTRAFGRALLDPAAPGAAAPEFRDTLRDVVERLAARDGTQVHWIDVGPLSDQRGGGVVDNVQVTGLRLEQPVAIARVPLTVVAELKNRGTASTSVQVTLEVDGGEPTRKVVQVEAGAEGEAEFQLTLRETGRRRLRVELQQDGLDADDSWCTTLEVRDRVRVLVVDGAADDDPYKTQAYFYRGMLDPASLSGNRDADAVPGELQMFDVTTADTLALLSGQQSPAAFDVTILADVDRLNERAATEIERALQAGKGLFVSLGRRVDPGSYDLQLFAAGEGPMPFRLGRTAGSPAGAGTGAVPVIALPGHAVLREFGEPIYKEILQAIPVHQWLSTAPGSLQPTAEVVLRLTDPDQSPLLVATRHGEGRAAFCCSAPGSEYDGDRWNRLDDHFIVHPLLFGIMQWLALPAQDSFNVVVGAPLSCSLPARPVDVEILLPERAGSHKQPVSEDSRPLPGGRYTLPAYASTTMAGFYVYDLQLERESGREPWSQPFAVNVDPEEGNLVYAGHDDVRQALGIQRVLTSLPSESTAAGDASANEFGPSLLLLTLLLVVGEAAMARYVSARRS